MEMNNDVIINADEVDVTADGMAADETTSSDTDEAATDEDTSSAE